MQNNAKNALEELEISELDELRQWLTRNHGQAESVWLITYKKIVPERYVAYGDIVDELLCFGWIDSQSGRVDAERTKVRISPRKPKSAWSRVNKAKVRQLKREGRMHPAGLERIAIAKRNGMWSFLDDVEALIVPDDLAQALASVPNAAANFQAFPNSAKRSLLEWIKTAKRDETRSKRLRATAQKAALNQKANQP